MSISAWNPFDWFLVVVVGLSTLLAFRRGLVRAIFGLLGFIGGFLFASWYYDIVGDWVMQSRLRVTQPTSRLIAFIVIVIAVSVVMEMCGRLLQKVLKYVGLGWFDRLLGMGFGFARGCLGCVIVLMVTTTAAPQSQLITTSVLAPYFLAVTHDVSFLIPQYLQEHMVNGAVDLKHSPPHWINRY